MNDEWIVFSCYTYDQRPLLRLLLLVLSDQTTTYQIAFYRLNSVSLISTIVYTIFFAHHEQQQTNFLCLSLAPCSNAVGLRLEDGATTWRTA